MRNIAVLLSAELNKQLAWRIHNIVKSPDRLHAHLNFACRAARRGFGQFRSTNQQSFDSQKKGTGTLQKLIVESGTATMVLDLNRLSGGGYQPMSNRQDADTATLGFDVAADSFFSVLVFNDVLRGPEQGSMALIPAGGSPAEAAVPAAGISVSQATRLPLQFAASISSIWRSKNSQAISLTSLCAIQKQVSPFLILKGTSTITTPMPNR